MRPRSLTLPALGQQTDSGSLFYIGTGTMLLHYAGFTILTDPNFVHRDAKIHLGYGAVTRRKTEPAMNIDDLPSLDLVLLSHMHGDHFDDVAQQKLRRTIPIVTTPHGDRKLRSKGFLTTYGLKAWETFPVEKGTSTLTITAMPGRHAPGLLSLLLPPVMGSLLEFEGQGRDPYRIYISGDTLVYDGLREIHERFPDIDLAILHLGQTRVFGLTVTMSPKQGVELMEMLQPKLAIPIHFNDYTAFKSSLDEFRRAVHEAGLERQVQYVHHGDTYHFN